jgi:hypothetical protein
LLKVQERKDVLRRVVEPDEGVDKAIWTRHVELLLDAGFLDGSKTEFHSGLPAIHIKDMSFSGHDFIGVLKNDGVWKKLKGKFTVDQLAALPLTIIKEVGIGFLKEIAMQQAGLKP